VVPWIYYRLAIFMPRKNMYIAVALALVVVAIFIFFGFFGVGAAPVVDNTPSTPQAEAQALLTDISKNGKVAELRVIDTAPGTGVGAKAGDTITVNYTGVLPDGTVFDSSEGKAPFTFVLGTGYVIKGWDQGLVGLQVGGMRLIAIPPELAYGPTGQGKIPPNDSGAVVMDPISFKVEARASTGLARAGVITTPHGSFNTPAFCTVGTKGTIKAILPRDLKEMVGAEVALSNTYHLFLQPGDDIVKEAGGLHKFMGWEGPLVTDSGGFQVFSLGAGFGKKISKFEPAPEPKGGGAAFDEPFPPRLTGEASDAAPTSAADPAMPTFFDEDLATSHGKLAIVDDEGVTFTSHIDGSLHRFTPERSVEIQHNLGADIFFAFDECTSPEADRDYQLEACNRTHEWARRSLSAHRTNFDAQKKQGIFGIVQGGRYPDLRTESAKVIGDMGFDGFGIGGSFSKKDLGEALVAAIAPLPGDKPRHLLGIGEPEDLFEGIANGIDMFDCVLPTRLGRTGTLYTRRGKIDIRKEIFARDYTALDPETGGYASDNFSRSYLHHLFKAKEMLGPIVASLHNLYFIVGLVKEIRQSILDDRFEEFRAQFLGIYKT
jgi:queuine tRNA-ribosyltransferase